MKVGQTIFYINTSFMRTATYMYTIEFFYFLIWAGVETKLIVEKGIWDEIFPLEGGGYVKMRLQFVLNDDERNRIRLMVFFRTYALVLKDSVLYILSFSVDVISFWL